MMADRIPGIAPVFAFVQATARGFVQVTLDRPRGRLQHRIAQLEDPPEPANLDKNIAFRLARPPLVGTEATRRRARAAVADFGANRTFRLIQSEMGSHRTSVRQIIFRSKDSIVLLSAVIKRLPQISSAISVENTGYATGSRDRRHACLECSDAAMSASVVVERYCLRRCRIGLYRSCCGHGCVSLHTSSPTTQWS